MNEISFEKSKMELNLINPKKLDQAIAWFSYFIIYKQRNRQVDFYSGYMETHEGYKREIFANAHSALHLNDWSEDIIGKHIILDYVIDGMKGKSNKGFNNILDHHDLPKLKDKAEEDIELAEEILFRLFKSEDVQSAFEDACEYFGRWYPTLSYLLFMRDCSKYLPVKNSKDNHCDRFRKLGISTACLDVCTWENYQVFLKVHQEVRARLSECFDKSISLLDAHSFVWTLWAAPDDLSFEHKEAVQKIKGAAEYIEDVITSRDYGEKSKEVVREIETEMDQIGLVGVERNAWVNVRCNQGIFKKRLQKRCNKCCLCGVQAKQFLIASHIKPWSLSQSEEKMDIDNGLLLCPNHDKLFDQGWITFSDNGNIIISEQMNKVDRTFMNVTEGMHINVREGNLPYLKFHREQIFIDNQSEDKK